jgi:hypothetical protein
LKRAAAAVQGPAQAGTHLLQQAWPALALSLALLLLLLLLLLPPVLLGLLLQACNPAAAHPQQALVHTA